MKRTLRSTCDCGVVFDTFAGFWVNKPVGMGGMTYDPRPKSPCGGRIGAPGEMGKRRFIKTQKTLVCVGCSLKYPRSTPPREMAFRESAKPR